MEPKHLLLILPLLLLFCFSYREEQARLWCCAGNMVWEGADGERSSSMLEALYVKVRMFKGYGWKWLEVPKKGSAHSACEAHI